MVLKHSEHAILDLTKAPAKKPAEKAKPGKKGKESKAVKVPEASKESGKKGDRRRRLSSRKKSESSGKEDEKPAKPQVRPIINLLQTSKINIFLALIKNILSPWVFEKLNANECLMVQS